MKTNKSCLRGLFLAVLLLGAQVSDCIAATKTGEDAQAYLKQAMAAMSALDGYRMEMAVDVVLPTASTNVTSGRDFFMRPVVGSRISSEMLLYDAVRISDGFCVRSYAKQSGKLITNYMNIDSQWIKRTVPYRSEEMYDDARMLLTSVKKAQVRELTAKNVLIDLTVDGRTGGKMIATMLGQGLPQAYSQVLRFLLDFKDGDITYIVGIDRHTGYLTRVDINLSEAIKQRILDIMDRPDSFAAQMSAERKKELQLELNNLQVTVQMMASKYNQVEPSEVPAEAIDQAIDEQIKGEAASAIGIIGGADGPTAIYVAGTLD